MMNIPRDHHFIPAFYLRRWCDPDNKLIEYTIKHGNLVPKPVGPDSTGYQFDLYAFPELPPDQSQFIEQKFFDYADRTASEALRLHFKDDGVVWTSELRSAWSRFVIALHLRHPDAMPEIRAGADAIWKGSGANAQQKYEEIRGLNDPPTFDEYIANRDPLISTKAKVNLIVKAFDNDIVGQHINEMTWGIIDVSTSTYRLLTSDRPVGFFNIKSPKGMISLPISPTRLFVAVNDPRILTHLRQRKARVIVGHVNTHLVTRARRFVWAADESQMSFIRKHMSTKLEPTPLLPSLTL